MKKLYKIVADIKDGLGVDYNAVVDVPAHLKAFMAFSKDSHKDYFIQNEEKRIVAGVMISADTEIYRNSKAEGEHYVFFPADTIDILRKKFFRNGYNNNLNEMHEARKKITPDGAYLIDSYIIDSKNPFFPNAPEAFESQDLKDGTWIGNYYIESDELWQKIKDGTFNGFSVEGYFNKVEIKTNKQMSKTENRFLKALGLNFLSEDPSGEPQTFVSATTADGTIVNYEGELAEGVIVTLEDGTPAPEGEHQLTLEDETVVVVNLDATGAVTSIQAVDDTEDPNAMEAEIAQAMKAMTTETLKEVGSMFEAMRSELNARFEAIEKSDKFNYKGKKTDGNAKGSWKQTIK